MVFLLKAKLLKEHGCFMTITKCIFHDAQS